TSRSNRRRAQSTSGCPARASCQATVPPIEPGPTIAIIPLPPLAPWIGGCDARGYPPGSPSGRRRRMTDPHMAQETIDYIALRRLQSAYADVVTRRAWPELEGLFRPEAEVVIDRMDGEPLVLRGPRAVGDFV